MTRTDTAAEFDFHTAGFIVKVQGLWTDGALQQFRRLLNLSRIYPSDDDLLGALQGANAKYHAGAAPLFVCTAEPTIHRSLWLLTASGKETYFTATNDRRRN